MDGQTDGHRAMASTADAEHHAVKMRFTEQFSPFQLDRLEDLMGYAVNTSVIC